MLAATLRHLRRGHPSHSASLQARWLSSASSSGEQVIQIDRSGLYNEDGTTNKIVNVEKEPETEIARHIKSLIQFRGGPITLAEYMSEVLTNPTAGYYVKRDVFGAGGDFTTSPEISQMFGEMIGIWCVAMWAQLGNPQKLRLVELGPGRGTLMADLLRGTAAFTEFSRSSSVCLVEVSPVLRRMQWEALGCQGPWKEDITEGKTRSGVSVTWHRSIDEIPADANNDNNNEDNSSSSPPALYLAHEFLDALPVHQFERGPGRTTWYERLVDEAPPDSRKHLRMVLSRGATPAARAVLPLRIDGLPPQQRASINAIEVSPQAMALSESLAQRVCTHGGAALIIDYGRDGPYRDSVVAIKDHKLVGILESPGTADLSARVDFDAVRFAVHRTGAVMHGPISQAQLLKGLGIEVRLERLLEDATPEQQEALIAGYKRLVSGKSSREDMQRGGGGGGGGGGAGTRRERRVAQRAGLKQYRGGAADRETEAVVETGAQGEEEDEVEGMGQSYKAVCICPQGITPVVFGV